ncbi:MAG: TlpA family protein disulfide reductase [Kofleriaceae bacterium]
MTRRARIAIAIAVLAGLQLGAIGIYVAVQRSRASKPAQMFASQRSSIAEAAPTITATRADGSPLSITWPAERVRIVHFWATWCPPCVKELPSLLAFARDMRGRGIEVIAIAVEDDWKDIASFFGGTIPPEVIVEAEGAAHKRFGVSTLPDSYLVGRDGRVIERYHGARDWSGSAAREHVLTRVQ